MVDAPTVKTFCSDAITPNLAKEKRILSEEFSQEFLKARAECLLVRSLLFIYLFLFIVLEVLQQHRGIGHEPIVNVC